MAIISTLDDLFKIHYLLVLIPEINEVVHMNHHCAKIRKSRYLGNLGIPL